MGFAYNELVEEPQAKTTSNTITDFPLNNDPSKVTSAPVNEPPSEVPPTAPSESSQSASLEAKASPSTEVPPTDGKPATAVTQAQPAPLIDWSKPFSEIEKNEELRKMTPQDIVRDFAAHGDGNWSVFMPWMSKYDPDKTIDQSIKDQKKAERQAKWEQWGNLFQHMGNFFGTAIGAPSQKIESMEELTERQRKVREGTEALRKKGYDQLLVNIYKDRADKQAQMQAEAAARANDAKAAYYGSQKDQVDALTPEKVKTERAKQSASRSSADLNAAKKETEDALRGKRGALLDAQASNANAGAADHRASVAVKGAQVKHINSQTEGQNQKNAAQQESDDFNYQYVNDPTFKKYANQWARNNNMMVGGNDDGHGGTWANEKNRRQAYKWAKEQMRRDRTPPSRRPNASSGSKVPPSRRSTAVSKTPPSRR